MEVVTLWSLVFNVLQVVLICLIIAKVLFGKDKGAKLVGAMNKSLKLLSSFKNMSNIVGIAEEIYQVVLNGSINEKQISDLFDYVKRLAGGLS